MEVAGDLWTFPSAINSDMTLKIIFIYGSDTIITKNQTISNNLFLMLIFLEKLFQKLFYFD